MILILSLLALAGAAGALGVVIGLAHGIEVERNRAPRLRTKTVEAAPEPEEIAV